MRIDIVDVYAMDVLCWFAYEQMRSVNDAVNAECRILRNEPFRSRSRHNFVDQCSLLLGTGEHTVTYKGERLTIFKQRCGKALATSGGGRDPPTAIHETLHVECESASVLQRMLSDAKKARDVEQTDTTFEIFRWWAKHNEWEGDAIAETRSLSSVILDEAINRDLLADINEFTSPETSAWYHKHCIPYKRGILLYGDPGCGKTSSIVAITSHLKRNIYRVNLAAPGLCDDSLFSAIQSVPVDSVVCFEDIDCLFGKGREKEESFCVTFSGLLNAVDGVNDYSRGLIFFFTTNHKEKLDQALLRPGRIDVLFHLAACTDAQIVAMFLKFYPTAADGVTKDFVKNTRRLQRERGLTSLTPAMLQHHFIATRRLNAEQSAAGIALPTDRSQSRCEAMYA